MIENFECWNSIIVRAHVHLRLIQGSFFYLLTKNASANLYNIVAVMNKLLHSIIGIECEWAFDAVESSLDINFWSNSWNWLETYAMRQQLALSLKGLFRSMLPFCLSRSSIESCFTNLLNEHWQHKRHISITDVQSNMSINQWTNTNHPYLVSTVNGEIDMSN